MIRSEMSLSSAFSLLYPINFSQKLKKKQASKIAFLNISVEGAVSEFFSTPRIENQISKQLHLLGN